VCVCVCVCVCVWCSLTCWQELFNFQQANLEGITERMGELIFSFAKSAETFDADELRNLIGVTQKYLSNLVSGFEDQREDDD
jgi:hypothetical protein